MRLSWSGLLLLLLVGVAMLLPAQGASAHAVLVQSLPAHGQNLEEPPSWMVLQFSEPVSSAFTPLVVRDSRGERVDLDDATIDERDPTRVRVGLKPLPAGLYTAVYRITSFDGHPVEGTIAFTVDQAAEAVPTAPAETAPPVVPASVSFTHGLALWSAVLLAGLCLFLVLASLPALPAGAARITPWAAGLLLLFIGSGLVETGLYAVRASGEAWSIPLWLQALTSSRVGSLWLWRAGLGALSAIALIRAARSGSLLLRGLYAIPGLALLLTFTLQSHAMATGSRLPVLADWVHLLAAAPWVGGLAGFVLLVRPALRTLPPEERTERLGSLVPRFSRVAMVSILLLTLTGLYGTQLHLPEWSALWTTAYGRSLSWKLLLLLPVIGLGAYNRFKRGRGRFRLAIGAELALLFGIFVAAGFLTSLPPAAVEIALEQGPFEESAQADGLTIGLKVTPNRPGFNEAIIQLADSEGNPVEGASTGLRLRMMEHDMGTQTLDGQETAPGTYTVSNLILGMPGEWQMEVATLTKGGREVRHAFQVIVPGLSQ